MEIRDSWCVCVYVCIICFEVMLMCNWRASEANEELSGLFNRDSRYIHIYRRADIFREVMFSWMLGFVVIHGKEIVVGSGLNYTPHACLEQWPLVSN